MDAAGIRMPLHRFAGTIRRNKHRDDRAHGRLQNPLAQNDVRAGEPSRRWEARWNKWKGQDKIALDSARKSAAAELDQIERGGDDLLARRAKRQDGVTVARGAAWFIATYIPRRQGLGKMAERTGIEYRRQLHAYVLPAIGHMRIAEVTRQDIEKLLDDRIGWNKASLYTRVRALVVNFQDVVHSVLSREADVSQRQ